MKKINLKLIIRIVCVLLMVFFFIPSFVVSCAGQDRYVSECTSSFGYYAYEEWIAPPLIWPLLLFNIPVAIMVLSFIKKIKERLYGLISSGLGTIQMILTIILCAVVAHWAAENMFEFRVLFGFVMNLILDIILISVSGFMLYSTINPKINDIADGKVTEIVGKVKNVTKDIGAKVNVDSQPAGNPNSSIPEIATASNNQPLSETKVDLSSSWFCTKCGTKNGADHNFCSKCGNAKA